MSEKEIKLTSIWRTDEFIVLDGKSPPSEEEASLIIDEKNSLITVRIPTNLSLITKRVIERRVSSIAKSGFIVPKSRIRIGAGFTVSIIKEDSIPDVLLQVGHNYSYGESVPIREETRIEEPRITYSSESEYIPTFLKQEMSDTEIQSIAKLEPTQAPRPEPVPIIVEATEDQLTNDENVAGRLVIGLAKVSDIYLSRKKDHFTAEYSAGRVDFTVKNGKVNILQTKRIQDDDKTLEQAISAAVL